MNEIRTEDHPAYQVLPPLNRVVQRDCFQGLSKEAEDQIIQQAIEILNRRMGEPGTAITSPQASKDYLRLNLADKEREHFAVLFLDNQNRVLGRPTVLFSGTVDSASVHPRIIVKAALEANANAVILCHNHPSGDTSPSNADRAITARLKDALALIDVRVLDHIIVGRDAYSFAEGGLL
jgi:DNA repair protein RadC